MRVVVLLLCWLPAVAGAQDLYLGGRLDFELAAGDATTFQVGRYAGVDLTISQPGVLDAYLDLSVAGGQARLQEAYLSFPQTRGTVDLALGRFLLPYGDPHLMVEDRYVDGAPDLFTTYGHWRGGNVLLDTDLLGLRVSPRVGPVTFELSAGKTPGSSHLGVAGRAFLETAGWRLGGSVFSGHDGRDRALTQSILHGAWSGGGVSLLLQGYVGHTPGNDHRGWTGRVAYRPTGTPWSLHLAHSEFNDDTQRALRSSRLGVDYRFARFYRAELRFEHNDAPGASERVLGRLTAVF